MNFYHPTGPRLAIGLAAMIMSAITISVLVVLPSKMEPDSQTFAMLASASFVTALPCATAYFKCVDLAAVRESASVPIQVVRADPRCKEQS